MTISYKSAMYTTWVSMVMLSMPVHSFVSQRLPTRTGLSLSQQVSSSSSYSSPSDYTSSTIMADASVAGNNTVSGWKRGDGEEDDGFDMEKESRKRLEEEKKRLFGLLRSDATQEDAILVDPYTKSPLTITAQSAWLAGDGPLARVRYQIRSRDNEYEGSSDTYLNLLEPVQRSARERRSASASEVARETRQTLSRMFVRQLTPFVPPPLRSILSRSSGTDGEYIPMRDLFTSPVVSFAYERGWRQGFTQAGFPGPDKEAQLALEYFEPVLSKSDSKVGVDMSCATGLFTRRFVQSGRFDRVLGCDYSDSMLQHSAGLGSLGRGSYPDEDRQCRCFACRCSYALLA
jgi:hypothetical protein